MKMIKKPVSILLSLIMIISLFTIVPFTANAAEGVSYISRWWDNDRLYEETRTRTDCKNLTDYTQEANHTLTSGWYVANDNVLFGRLTISGEVHIIIPDDKSLRCTKGVIVNYSHNTLNIYGQENNTGRLVATNSSNDDAAIGSYSDTGCGTIKIHGGDVSAHPDDDAPGIGCGKNGKGGTIIIYGGKVNASGAAYGAGIGAGDSCLTSGDVYIYGGEVTATGGKRGAGIGGGNHSDGCSVVILGGEVTATGGEWGAGIGGGNKALGGSLVIGGDAKVTARGGFGGAGVGGGDGACVLPYHYVDQGLQFRMYDDDDCELTAIGGDEAAGIGGGNQEDSVRGYIDIRGGTVNAIGGANYGAGIGGGDQQGYYTEYTGGFDVPHGYEIRIAGGEVTATGGKRAAGIGGGDKGNGSKLNIIGGDVTAYGGENAAGIGGGNGGSGGNVTIDDNPIITAYGGIGGAGVGSGNGGAGGNVKIELGTINATGGDYAAGIGGGNNTTDFGNITINECTAVNAQGGKHGAGIGGGEKSTAGTVTINGADEVNATGGLGGAGIGKGSGTAADAINVTINGGIVNATGGDGLFDKRQGISVNCAPAIGGNSFSGTINLNGGNIKATGAKDKHINETNPNIIDYNNVYGTAIGSNSSNNPRTGTVNIKAGAVIDTHIIRENSTYSYHYYANAINFIDTEEGRSCVQYDDAFAAAADRVKACGWKAAVIHIEPCVHGEFIYTNKDSEHHNTICLYCGQTFKDPHNDALTSWTWIKSGNIYTQATANFTCADCGNTVSVTAKVTFELGDVERYTATAEHNGTVYSTTRVVDAEGQIVEDGVVITFKNSDGKIIKSEIVPLGTVPDLPIVPPRKPGADSSLYDFAGWSDGSVNYLNENLPAAQTQTTYIPVYKYRDQTAPYIDASGEYIPGKEKHYLINGKYYEVNTDGSVGVQCDSVDISDFEFVLLGDDTYCINRYTGQTESLTELVIPKSYKNKPVTVVGDDSQNKLFTEASPQFTLVLNENIKKIGAYTFWGLEVATVTGDTSALNQIGQSAFSWANKTGNYALDVKLDYPGLITLDTDAFNNTILTLRIKHATTFSTDRFYSQSHSFIFTDAHVVTPTWHWEDDYSGAMLTLACSDTRCAYHETFDAEVTSKTTDNKIIYTATVEAMGETYTDTKENNNYKITALESDHGKVETGVQQAREGEQVTVTSVPDEGYHLSSVSVAKDTRIPLTYLMGGNGYENEKGDKLIDGDKSTMWRQNNEGHWTVIMKADSMVSMAGYSLTTGNTVADNPGSNWKSWTISGGDFESDTAIEGAAEGWTPIVEVVNDTVLQAENNRTFDFTLSTPAQAYKYYLIMVIDSKGADFIQMSEFELKTEEESVALSGEGDTRSFDMPAFPVIVSAEFEPDLHTVTWLNEDGTVLETDENVPYGSTPVFNGTVPPKADCTFMGWKDENEDFYAPDELPEVTGDVTYTAVFGAGDGLGSELVGYSVSLEGDIAVNFYMELSDFVIAHEETAYMRFAVPGENGATEQKVYVRNAKVKELGDKTYYAFKCRVAAKEMTSEIKARLIDGSKVGDEYTYSVKQYADYLLTHTSGNAEFAKAAPLVRKMLNYGAYAQLYFDRNADNLANKGLPEEDKELGSVTVTEPQTAFHLPEGVSFEGSTLSLKSETTLSLYFKSSKTLAFSVDGKTVETAKSGGYQIARIRGIPAKELKDSFTLSVTAGESSGSVTYSPMNYCAKVLSGGTDNETLSNVTKALVLYAQAAEEYFSLTP